MIKFNVGLIGLGRQTVSDHLPALLRRSDINIAWACDVGKTARNNFRHDFSKTFRT